MKYRSVVATKRGSPGVLQVVENDLREPAPGEARIRILAVPVCGPDIQARYGHTPFPPRVPFVPGYAFVGVVDAIGEGVTRAAVGDLVAALTIAGGYAEYAFLRQEALIPIPASLDPVKASTLILNYLVAYQCMHRSAKVKPGDKVLVIGASGGIGTAFLQLGKLAGLTMYGIASSTKQSVLIKFGATPIDYRTQDFVEVIHRAEPEGLDTVFDGMGGDYVGRGLSVLRRGGRLVLYGNPMSKVGLLRLLARTVFTNLSPNGKTIKLYGTTASRFNRRPFLEDWSTLFRLLKEARIDPVIDSTFPIPEADKANALMESGQVTGHVVLLSPELL